MAERASFWVLLMMLTVSVIVLQATCYTAPATTSAACKGAPSCSCSRMDDDTVKMNCSGRGLSQIPDILSAEVSEIYLDHNKITHVHFPGSYPKLQILDISKSSVENISQDAFSNMPRLHHIDLKDNLFNMKHLPRGIFSSLNNLRYLDISGNFVSFMLKKYGLDKAAQWLDMPWTFPIIEIDYRNDLYEHLVSINHLSIDGYPQRFNMFNLFPLPTGLGKLRNLNHIKVRGVLFNITKDTFAALKDLPLKSLTLWSSWLYTIDADTFQNFPQLEVLDLSYNPTLNLLDLAERTWPGLVYTNIKKLVLSRASPFSTDLVNLEERFFYGLEKTNITHLNLDGNHIVTVAPVFSTYLPHLQNLSMAYNRMEALPAVDNIVQDIGTLKNIKFVDFSYQYRRLYVYEADLLTSVYSSNIGDNTKRRKRSTNSQLDQYLQNQLGTEAAFAKQSVVHVNRQKRDGQQYDYQFDISDTIWKDSVPDSSSFIPTWTFHGSNSLEEIHLSQSLAAIATDTPELHVTNAKSLRKFVYRDNGIRVIEKPIYFDGEPPTDILLDLSDNGMTKIIVNTTANDALTGLILENNDLGQYLADSTSGMNAFSHTRKLCHLDLSGNNIKTLHKDMLSQHYDVERLDLSGNSLYHVDIIHNDMQLQELDVQNNLIQVLGSDARDTLNKLGLKQLKTNSTLKLFLKGNPLVCSCDHLNFLTWAELQREELNGITLIDIDEYSCFHDGNMIYWTEPKLNSVIKSLKISCNKNTYIITASVLAGIVLIVAGLSVFLRRHRWEIKFWFISNVLKKKQGFEEAYESKQFDYDGFVSFHQNDLRWIMTYLIPNIEEGDLGFSLCIHQRDFELGAPIEENIVKSIQNSKKTFLILSSSFLNSGWCEFELHMAQLQSFDVRCDVIIPILLESLDVLASHPNMTHTLKAILKKRTYIEWPGDSTSRQKGFWSRLRDCLTRPSREVMLCTCGKPLAGSTSTESVTSLRNNNESVTTFTLADTDDGYSTSSLR